MKRLILPILFLLFCPNLMGQINQNFGQGGTGTFTNIVLPDSTSSNVGVLIISGNVFLSDYPGSANFNTWVGTAGNFTLTGTANVGVGYQAAKAVTSGSGIVAIGYQSLLVDTTGGNTCVGYFTCHAVTTGTGITIMGNDAYQNGTAIGNTCVGATCLQLTSTGANNTCVGLNCSQLNTTGLNNVGMGERTMMSGNLTAATALGEEAMQFATGVNNNGSDNCIGVHCIYQSTNSSFNNCIGRACLYRVTTGTGNIGVGYYSTSYVPPDGLTLALTAGTNLGIGIYAYKVSFVLNGVETGLQETLNQTITTTTGNQAVNLTAIPTYVGPLTATARNIYRTKVGFVAGNQRWFLITTIADNTTTTFSDTVADASLVTENVDPNFQIITGYFPNVADKTCYKSSQFCMGSDSGPITEAWLGRSVYSATPSDILVSATGGLGSNIAGANMVLSGGPGTGSAASGKVIFKTAAAGSSGALWNPVAEVAEVNPTGFQALTYQTVSNCAANGTAANPSVVSCGSAAAGMFSCATNATTATCQVNTTAVTANSEIQVIQDSADGGASQLNVTCEVTNSLPTTKPLLLSKSAGANFILNMGTITTNPACFEYTITN